MVPINERVVCNSCGASFERNGLLLRHLRTVHSNEANLRTLVQFYNCSCCNYSTPRRYTLKTHILQKHGLNKHDPAIVKCPLCSLETTRSLILEHYHAEHDIVVSSGEFEFKSYEEFLEWKSSTEATHCCKFFRRSFHKTSDGCLKSVFCCHRDGFYDRRRKKNRTLKVEGSNKIGGHCPAAMYVEVSADGKALVLFHQTHVGHQREVDRKRMKKAKDDKDTVTRKSKQVAKVTEQCSKLLSSVDKSATVGAMFTVQADPEVTIKEEPAVATSPQPHRLHVEEESRSLTPDLYHDVKIKVEPVFTDEEIIDDPKDDVATTPSVSTATHTCQLSTKEKPLLSHDKRKRGTNFTHDERAMLIRLANSHSRTIENKKTDNISAAAKNKAWDEIEVAYNAKGLCGPPRDAKSLRVKYEAIKRELRKVDQQGRLAVGGPSQETRHLTEDEVILRDNMAISMRVLSPTVGNCDGGFASGLALSQTQDTVEDEEIADITMDWTDDTPLILQASIQPSLQHLNSGLGSPPLEYARTSTSSAIADLPPASTTKPTRAVSPGEENNPITSTSQDQTALLRPVELPRSSLLKKKRSLISAAGKSKQVGEMRLKLMKKKDRLLDIYLATAELNRERAAVQLEIEKKRLRAMDK